MSEPSWHINSERKYRHPHGSLRAISGVGIIPSGRARACGQGQVLLFRCLRFFSLDHSQLCTELGDGKIRAKLPSGRFVQRVVPEYPSPAKQMNVSGKVKMEATVAADRQVVTTKVIGGSPLLINSALEALKRWASIDTAEIVEFDFNPQGN
jgi:hypothetical protein